MRVLVLAGGKGTRLRPLTDTRPKPLVPFMGAPFAEGLLRRLRDARCERVTFLVGGDPGPFAPLCVVGARLGMEVALSTEEVPLGTAGAARRLLREAEGPVLVCNGDILTDLDYRALLSAHDRSGAPATIALTRVDDPSSFGVVTTDRAGRVTGFIEKPPAGTAPALTVNAGTYVLDPDALAAFEGDGELSFEREVFPGLLEAGEELRAFLSDAHWGDLGTPERYRAGHAVVLSGRCAWPSGAGLELRSRGVVVHETAEVAHTALLSPPTLVGGGAVVGEGARLEGAVVLEQARVGDGAVVQASIVGEGASIGSRATVASDAVVGDGATVAAGVRLPANARVGAGETVSGP